MIRVGPPALTLSRDRTALAGLEFALIAPVLGVFLMGTLELTNAFRVQARLNTAAGQLIEMIAAQQSVTAPNGNLQDICAGAAMNLLPFPSNKFSADILSGTNDHPSNRVAGSTDSTSVNIYLDWENISSCAIAAPGYIGGVAAYNLANSPTSLLTKSGAPATSAANLQYGYSVIVVKTYYTYANVLPFLLPRSISLTAIAVARPRSNTTIACTGAGNATACPPSQ